MNSTRPDLEQIKSSMRTQWMAGDFGEIASLMAGSGSAFVERLNLAPGTRVLDVACGTGNLAIPLSRAGCAVTGVDIAPNLLAQARERAREEHLTVTFEEGDAEQLPYPDACFDGVVSMFGAMFAPRPEIVVAEFARVLRPGGLLAMANWNPNSFSGAMFRVSARHAPPPPGLPPPVLWGDREVLLERLGHAFDAIECELVPIPFDLHADPKGVVAFFRRFFGPTQMAFLGLEPDAQAAFAEALEALWSRANVAPDPTQQTLVHNEYLRVTARRR